MALSAANEAPMQRNVMVDLGGDFREVSNVPQSLAGAQMAIRQTYGFGQGAVLQLQWVDDDGDTITVSSDDEWLEAFKSKSDLLLTVTASGDTTKCSEPQSSVQSDAAREDDVEEWVVVDKDAISARNSVQSDSPAAQSQSEDAARENEQKEREKQELDRQKQELDRQKQELDRQKQELDRQKAADLEQERLALERKLEQERKDREEMERRAQLEMEELKQAEERAEAERKRLAEEQSRAAKAALEAAAAAEAAAASVARVVHPKKTDSPSALNLDADQWGLVLQLQEMGFGNDHARLHKILKDHHFDLTSAVEALAAEAAV